MLDFNSLFSITYRTHQLKNTWIYFDTDFSKHKMILRKN